MRIEPVDFKDLPQATGAWPDSDAVRFLGPAEPVDRDNLGEVVALPGVGDPDAELALRREAPRSYVPAAPAVARLVGASIETTLMCAITSSGSYIADTIRVRRQALRNGYGAASADAWLLPETRADRLEGPAVLVGLPVGRNYFHWWFEAGARWALAADLVPPDALVLTQPLHPHERAVLDLVGVPAERVRELEPGVLLHVDSLLVPSRGVKDGLIAPHAARGLHAMAEATANPARRLFVARRTARRRRLLDEEIVAAALAALGFEEVQSESLSVGEQADLFASASVVVATHGAGLANCCFCPPGALVVELQPEGLDERRRQLYWNLAAAAGLAYAQAICPASGDRAGDLRADPDALSALVARLLEGFPAAADRV
jgi:capsular polysaccharide biosynthesis protein